MPDYSCAHCRYDLTGLQAPGRCPECGTDFDHYARVWAARRPWRGLIPLGLTLVAVTVAVLRDGTDPEELLHLVLFLAVVTTGIVIMYRKYFNHDVAAVGISADYLAVRQALDELHIPWDNVRAIEPGRFRSIKIERVDGEAVWVQWAFGLVGDRDDCVEVLRAKLAEYQAEADESGDTD